MFSWLTVQTSSVRISVSRTVLVCLVVCLRGSPLIYPACSVHIISIVCVDLFTNHCSLHNSPAHSMCLCYCLLFCQHHRSPSHTAVKILISGNHQEELTLLVLRSSRMPLVAQTQSPIGLESGPYHRLEPRLPCYLPPVSCRTTSATSTQQGHSSQPVVCSLCLPRLRRGV